MQLHRFSCLIVKLIYYFKTGFSFSKNKKTRIRTTLFTDDGIHFPVTKYFTFIYK